MKTPVEMQLKIIGRMGQNIEDGNDVLDGIEFYSAFEEDWVKALSLKNSDFSTYRHRIKPKTTRVNGIEIPKPLGVEEIIPGGHDYFMPCLSNQLFISVDGYQGQKFEYKHLYTTKEEAIEASKLLFGLKD